ncbi:MAG: Smr/MutS family protein [Sphingobium sp.]|nr:Smr/MutS family protein [Sphingobium sp.]MBP6112189.1 Smr/MutS family protein [Sphingobium sp.]MBP8670046.1 Smr/MutS family protein [Sphingobium sp.]MBP9157089.1 Smr/MutS family protein [Sphingobium sp.]MCC6481318.1 Smr/MutS family protein [Sphingomonadaceae bacterium]
MLQRRLSPEEREIWERLARSVTPLAGRKAALPSANLPASLPDGALAPAASRGLSAALPASSVAPPAPRRTPQPVLDSSWERRIGNGTLAPDATIDLHGHTLDTAHQRLNHALATAVTRGHRVLLVVTGNPRPSHQGPVGHKARGAIRAEIGDWMALSGHADAIASVRTAHPRHGGKGALYVILRRKG